MATGKLLKNGWLAAFMICGLPMLFKDWVANAFEYGGGRPQAASGQAAAGGRRRVAVHGYPDISKGLAGQDPQDHVFLNGTAILGTRLAQGSAQG